MLLLSVLSLCDVYNTSPQQDDTVLTVSSEKDEERAQKYEDVRP